MEVPVHHLAYFVETVDNSEHDENAEWKHYIQHCLVGLHEHHPHHEGYADSEDGGVQEVVEQFLSVEVAELLVIFFSKSKSVSQRELPFDVLQYLAHSNTVLNNIISI